MFGTVTQDLQRAELLLDGVSDRRAISPDDGDAPIAKKILAAWCVRAGLSEVQRRKILVRTSAEVALCVFVTALIHSYLPLCGIPLFLAIEWFAIARRVTAKIYGFERDYTALLLSLASAIRTGLDPLSALNELPKLFDDRSEVKRELLLLTRKLDSGMAEEQALREFGSTIRHPDIPLFTTAFILSRREGSSIAECLQRLARVTRQRQSFRRKIRSAVAMQKLSAIGIGLSALAIGVVQALSNPKGLAIAIESPVGSKLLELGVFLIASGMIWMTRLASPKV